MNCQSGTPHGSINKKLNHDQFLYIREKTDRQFAVFDSIFSYLYSSLKVFRSSPYSFRTKVFTAFGPIVNGFLPHSVFPPDISRKQTKRYSII